MAQTSNTIHETVRERYAAKAKSSSSCCDSSDCCQTPGSKLYPKELLEALPEDISDFSLGCGNPIAIASLHQGETVLDLGSGGGLDCFLAARQVGERGHVIGVDMTPEMIERARENARRMSMVNVEFRQGYLEEMPVEDNSIDVVISNCVINLTPDKFKVFREIFRVLKAGRRLAISDVVSNGPLPQALKENVEAWGDCLGGALEIKEYTRGLEEAGFENIKIEPKDAGGTILSKMPVGVPFSALITATKPV
ncbi:MAG TPA: arsenite methyltransferase [Anaerolineales bacterium]|nr:arsenite methyltransferase [Anaerolineales bacterium]